MRLRNIVEQTSRLVLTDVFTFTRLRVPLHHGNILKAPFRHDTTLPTPDPMFRVLRPRFSNIVDDQLLNRVSLYRLFRMGGTVYLPDIYCLSTRYLRITLCIDQIASFPRLFCMGESDYLGR